MKNTLVLIFLFVSFANHISAQLIGKDSVAIIAYWEQGDQKKYEYTKRKLEKKDNKKAQNEQTRKLVSFRVNQATEEAYLIEYKTEKVLDDPAADKAPGAEQIVQKLMKDFRYEYQTDDMGGFVELKNWEELSEATNRVVKMLLSLQGGSASQNKKAMKTAMSMSKQLTTQEGMEAAMRKEIGAFSMYHGYVFPLNVENKYDEEIENLYGGEPFPAYGTFIVTDIDTKNKTVKLASSLSLDAEKSKAILIKTMKKMMKSVGGSLGESMSENEMDEELKDLRYEMTETSYIIYNYETGWVEESNRLRKTTISMPGEGKHYGEEERTFKMMD